MIAHQPTDKNARIRKWLSFLPNQRDPMRLTPSPEDGADTLSYENLSSLSGLGKKVRPTVGDRAVCGSSNLSVSNLLVLVLYLPARKEQKL